jgi:tRNA1Val (adenine37-N6)-methyltransferase
MKSTESSETCDRILGGSVRVIQPRRGYRFSVDSILLARFVSIGKRDRLLELGAGTGVISLAIAALHRPREIVAIEIQPELVAMLRRNVELNAASSIRAIVADLRNLDDANLPREGFDLVVANPPFRARGTGRASPNQARRIARSETSAALEDFVRVAARYTRRGGRAALVFAADRSAELIWILREHRLEPKRIRFVHAYVGAPATNILVEARKNGGVEAAIESPLVLFDAPGVYTREAREILGEEVASPLAAE